MTDKQKVIVLWKRQQNSGRVTILDIEKKVSLGRKIIHKIIQKIITKK